MMNKRQLRKRLMITLISIVSCIAIMAVGVYAASNSFEVQVQNEVSINIEKVDGNLYGKRGGDVLLGTVSLGDEGLRNAGTTYDEQSGVIEDFIQLYDNIEGINSDNITEIQKSVNFYKPSGVDVASKPNLTIFYVFKFELADGASSNINLNLDNTSTPIDVNDSRYEMITQEYKYFFGVDEPTNWAEGENIKDFGIENGGNKTITVMGSDASTHVVYIYASLSVRRTDALNKK